MTTNYDINGSNPPPLTIGRLREIDQAESLGKDPLLTPWEQAELPHAREILHRAVTAVANDLPDVSPGSADDLPQDLEQLLPGLITYVKGVPPSQTGYDYVEPRYAFPAAGGIHSATTYSFGLANIPSFSLDAVPIASERVVEDFLRQIIANQLKDAETSAAIKESNDRILDNSTRIAASNDQIATNTTDIADINARIGDIARLAREASDPANPTNVKNIRRANLGLALAIISLVVGSGLSLLALFVR